MDGNGVLKVTPEMSLQEKIKELIVVGYQERAICCNVFELKCCRFETTNPPNNNWQPGVQL